MSEKITELTQDQESRFDEYVDKWIKIGLSTKETDVDKVLEIVPRFYEAGG